MTARTTLRATRKTAATAPATPIAAFSFPKRSDFHFDFPRGTDFGLSPLVFTKPLGKPLRKQSAGVARSWGDASVKAARTTKHGVTVKAGGKTTEHKSVAAAFKALGLPMPKHIKFRGKLKASRKEVFEHNGVMHAFRLVESD
jgi:hypothetical protein